MAPEHPDRADPSMVAAEVAALVEQVRQKVTFSLGREQPSLATVEGRFLRRLLGALTAYEAASGILLPAGGETEMGRRGSGLRLDTLTCPGCGASEFTAVGRTGDVRLLCRRCGVCSIAGGERLALVDQRTCPKCEFEGLCFP